VPIDPSQIFFPLFCQQPRFPIFQQPNDIADFPETIRNASGHRRRDFERLVDAEEIVVHKVKRDRRDVVHDLFAKAVRQPGEPAHPHSHREVLALNVAGTDVLAIRVAGDRAPLCADALRRAVAGVIRSIRAVDLD
jgi:hypothetical protein